jgi:hypothetical protein
MYGFEFVGLTSLMSIQWISAKNLKPEESSSEPTREVVLKVLRIQDDFDRVPETEVCLPVWIAVM